LSTTTAAATTTTGALAGRGRWRRRRSDDNVSGAHIGDIGKIPDAFLAGFTTEVNSPVGQFRCGLAEQRIVTAATAAATTTTAGRCITACGRGRLLAERNQSHCDEPYSSDAENNQPT
jgi:hypothetical protein